MSKKVKRRKRKTKRKGSCFKYVLYCFIGLFVLSVFGGSDSKDELKQSVKSHQTQSTHSEQSPTSTPKPTASPIPTVAPESTASPIPTVTPEPTPYIEMVWISNSGSKYHSRSSCSNMRDPWEIPLDDAISRGYEPCKRCE